MHDDEVELFDALGLADHCLLCGESFAVQLLVKPMERENKPTKGTTSVPMGIHELAKSLAIQVRDRW